MHSRSFHPLLALAALLPASLGHVIRPNGDRFSHSRAHAAVYHNCNDANTVALTFDDGPYIFHTQISDILSDAGILGTFFVNGDNFDCIYDPAQVSSLQKSFGAGHQIASHTWSHPNLTTLNEDQIRDEFESINSALQKILGIVPAVMRPPFGEHNAAVQRVADSLGQSIIHWSFDSRDADGATPQESVESYRQLAEDHPDGIISLQHETKKPTADDVLPFAIRTLRDAGYNFATISECLGIPAYQSTQSPGERDSSWTC